MCTAEHQATCSSANSPPRTMPITPFQPERHANRRTPGELTGEGARGSFRRVRSTCAAARNPISPPVTPAGGVVRSSASLEYYRYDQLLRVTQSPMWYACWPRRSCCHLHGPPSEIKREQLGGVQQKKKTARHHKTRPEDHTRSPVLCCLRCARNTTLHQWLVSWWFD